MIVRGVLLASLVLTQLGVSAWADPHVDYMLECQGCHLDDGSGAPGAVPDLRSSLGPLLRAEGGRAFLIRVPGSATSLLSDADLAGVLNWMVDRFAPPEAARGFVPYGPSEVGELRAQPLLEVDRVRAVLLEAGNSASHADPILPGDGELGRHGE